jgi:hypothetical protein
MMLLLSLGVAAAIASSIPTRAHAEPVKDPMLSQIVVPLQGSVQVATWYNDEDGPASLTATPTDGADGGFLWCSVYDRSVTILNNASPVADACTVDDDANTDVDGLVISAAYRCEAAGRVVFQFHDSAGSSNPVTLTCGDPDFSPSDVRHAVLRPQSPGTGGGKATLTPIEGFSVVTAEVRGLNPQSRYMVRLTAENGCQSTIGGFFIDLRGRGSASFFFTPFSTSCGEPHQVSIVPELQPGAPVDLIGTFNK